jgi:glutamate 5-kinase
MTDSANNLIDRAARMRAAKTWVIKVGSRSLTKPGGGLDLEQVARLSDGLAQLTAMGKNVVFVSSGAVASGVGCLGLPGRPKDLATLQAVAAVGQAQLMQAYRDAFHKYKLHVAQVLLTASDLDDRVGYLNVRNTLIAIHQLGAIPIINENDTVSVEELQTTFGDNDRLAAMVAGIFERPLLVILSDVQGLYDRDPSDPTAKVISTVARVDNSILELVRDRNTGVSKGGMASKLAAARFVNSSGAGAIIAYGKEPDVLVRLANGEDIGTYFHPAEHSMEAKKRWIGFTAQCAGKVIVDAGAAQAIITQNRSLLPIGIREVAGTFEKGDTIAIMDIDGHEVARGQSNYASSDIEKIRGLKSSAIEAKLGHCPYETVVHRDNLVLSPTQVLPS